MVVVLVSSYIFLIKIYTNSLLYTFNINQSDEQIKIETQTLLFISKVEVGNVFVRTGSNELSFRLLFTIPLTQ